MIRYKTPDEIQIMKEGGAILARILHDVAAQAVAGIPTAELEHTAAALMKQYKVASLFKGHEGYPAVSCISVNEQVVHGIPKDTHFLCDGDIVSIDAGIRYKGLCLDSAITVSVGSISNELQKLMDVTKNALFAGIAQALVGNTTGDIGHTIEKYVLSQGTYGIVRQLVGHGVGHELHEEPHVPNFGKAGTGVKIEPGLVIAIEPMITLGTDRIKEDADGWTISTTDGSYAAHFEHSVAVTVDGPIILTELR